MNPLEADDMALRIIRTWPKMLVPPDEWRDALTPLDVGTVGTAFIRLRNSDEHPPSIAKFLATYKALPTASNQPIPATCRTCNGDGFVSGTEIINGLPYPVCYACRCPNGANAQRQLDEAREANKRERRRMFPGKDAA